MKMKFFDFEVYPNWWCVVVSDEEPTYRSKKYNYAFNKDEEDAIKAKMRVYTSDDGEEGRRQYLIDSSTGVLTGYRSKMYDLIIQKCISMQFTPRQIFIANQIITKHEDEFPEGFEVTQNEIARIKQYVTGWRAKWQGAQASQDLSDDSDKGLKDKEASYGMDIRETTVPFGKMSLTAAEKEDIIFYCKHDVFALHVHYVCVAKPYIETKVDLALTYDIPEKTAYECTNAVLVGKVLGAERVHGTTIVDPTIRIYEEPLRNYIEKWVPKEALQHLLTSQKPKQLVMFGNKVYMADGGIHSTIVLPQYGKDIAVYAEATEEYGLFNIDLSGCHPSVMLYAGAMSRAVKHVQRFEETVRGRRKLKFVPKSTWTPEEVRFVAGSKLVHNVTYGAMGNDKLPLYDDYMRSKVCRVSQLVIIAVAMNIWSIDSSKIKILQTNTDGILFYMPRSYVDEAKRRIAEFEAFSNFAFSLDEDSKIWQLNVNNYIALDIDGKDKKKGKTFVTNIWQPGTNKVRPLGYHILAKAQYEFYVNGINPIKFMLEHENVDDFAMNATKGPTYSNMIHTVHGVEYDLGRVSRIVAVENPKYGDVRKIKGTGKDLVANCPPHAYVVNDALYNYYIEGNYGNRSIVHKDGYRERLDMLFYSKLLERVLDKTWYKLKDGTITLTDDFNLSKFLKGGN